MCSVQRQPSYHGPNTGHVSNNATFSPKSFWSPWNPWVQNLQIQRASYSCRVCILPNSLPYTKTLCRNNHCFQLDGYVFWFFLKDCTHIHVPAEMTLCISVVATYMRLYSIWLPLTILRAQRGFSHQYVQWTQISSICLKATQHPITDVNKGVHVIHTQRCQKMYTRFKQKKTVLKL